MTDIDVEATREGTCTYRAKATGLVAAPAWRVLNVMSDPEEIRETFRDVRTARVEGRVLIVELDMIGALYLARAKNNTVTFWSAEDNPWVDLRGTWTASPMVFNATCRMKLEMTVRLKMAWLRMFPVASLISSKVTQSYEDLDERWKTKKKKWWRPFAKFFTTIKMARNPSRGNRSRNPAPAPGGA